ncbi:TRAP transporter substrate-binding protein [Jeotgalicoccus marinus]|uniref:TRAP transporter substrate-binding protein n=1 Tax=Jeotgalicoccus marinus TaxID=516700 RepID=UPI0003FB1E17|nr:TRAP transporter substrate-binding protein [Jeotgalicoccus marinus]
MKKILSFFIISMTIVALNACKTEEVVNNTDVSSSRDVTTITFSHNQSALSTEHMGALKFKEVIEKESNGKVKVDVYPSSQLGGLREQVEATQIGEIDITLQPAATITLFEDDVKIVDLPYLLPTKEEEMYQVLDSEVGTEILNTLNDSSLEGLGFWPGGYKMLTSQNTQIENVQDLKGLSMRTMESPVLVEQFKTWQASAIPIAYSEVYNSLQLGIVDGQENPVQTIYMNNYHEVQNSIAESYHGAMTYILIANEAWFNSLDEEIQDYIISAEKQAKEESRSKLKEKEGEYRKAIIANVDHYYEFTEDDIKKSKALSEPLWDAVYDTPKQQEILEKFKEKINEVEHD